MRWKLHVPDVGDVLAEDRDTIIRLQEVLAATNVDSYVYTRTSTLVPWRMTN